MDMNICEKEKLFLAKIKSEILSFSIYPSQREKATWWGNTFVGSIRYLEFLF